MDFEDYNADMEKYCQEAEDAVNETTTTVDDSREKVYLGFVIGNTPCLQFQQEIRKEQNHTDPLGRCALFISVFFFFLLIRT